MVTKALLEIGPKKISVYPAQKHKYVKKLRDTNKKKSSMYLIVVSLQQTAALWSSVSYKISRFPYGSICPICSEQHVMFKFQKQNKIFLKRYQINKK